MAKNDNLKDRINSLIQDTNKMRALTLNEVHSIHLRQHLIHAYDVVNYALLYNSNLANKEEIPSKYRIPQDQFMEAYKKTLLQLKRR